MIITTGDQSSPKTEKRAITLAAETGSVYVRRNSTSLAKMSENHKGEDILIILKEEVRLYREGYEPMVFHPSMAFVRAKRLLKGEPDSMLEVARVTPGDTIIDCTAGLGADSMVFSLGAGPEGKVLALEASLSLSALLREGLSSYECRIKEFNEALRRIEVRCADHLEVLRGQPDKSADVVYFDPMFRIPLLGSASISPLRKFANNNSLSTEAVAEACRVARKTVVLKEKNGSGEFERLGFTNVERAQSKIVYGVISLDN